MNRDRLTQLFALTFTLACLVAAVLLMPTINGQRRDLQLSFDIEVGDRVDARYAIAAAATGSFRGLAVDMLWYRIERLKNEGKFWEAATLAEWITTLQPRFPQVWAFHGWNMAYNISVQTHTPEERWNWVSKGIQLIRDEGIPNNPISIRLYRELGWIFFHKVGQYSDDMHWYYKLQHAQEWQEILGTPVQGATAEQAVANFRHVAEAGDRYFQLDQPSLEMRQTLDELAEELPEYKDELIMLGRRGLAMFIERVPRLVERMRASRQYQPAERLEAMLETAHERLARSTRDPLTLLYRDVPTAQQAVQALRDIGLDADETTLRRVGRLEMYLLYTSPRVLVEQGREVFGLNEQDMQLVNLLMNTEYREGVTALLSFLRARALVRQYHMDPAFMLQLMEDYGPLDWRHPATHGVYWSAKGVDMVREVRDRTNIDLLNTNRNVIHGLQSLMRTGRVNYDPLNGRIDLVPEPAFIPAYEKAMFAAEERTREIGLDSAGTMDHFEAGHENFLHTAIVFSYLYGDVEQARQYYDRMRELYGHRHSDGRYQVTLADFVVQTLAQDGMQMHHARQFVDAMITNGLTQGLAQGRVDVFNRFFEVARSGYERYQQERSYANPNAPRERMALPPTFGEAFSETYIAYMRSPQNPLLDRSRVYANTPTPIRRETYPYFREQIRQHAEQAGWDADQAFPAPPDIDERELRGAESQTPDTVERQ